MSGVTLRNSRFLGKHFVPEDILQKKRFLGKHFVPEDILQKKRFLGKRFVASFWIRKHCMRQHFVKKRYLRPSTLS